MEIINKRRSIRTFDNQLPISDNSLELLLKAAMQAPSARNEQPWEFIVIKDPQIIKELSTFIPRALNLQGANKVIITLTNLDKATTKLYEQDMACATNNILLEATELGIASFWIGVASLDDRTKAIVDYFMLPDNIKPFSLIALGYPLNKDDFKFIDRYNINVIHTNRW